MKKLIATLTLIVVTDLLSAHEFWLQPDKFIYEPGESINIRFNVGENFQGENWNGDTSRIKTLDFYYGDVRDDLEPALGTGKGDSIQFSVLDEGTAMVTFNSRNSFIVLDSGKFNAYLLEDGLDEALEYRRQHQEMDSVGAESYQRSVKTIFQVGGELTNTFLQPTRLPLDIILQKNPYELKSPETVSAKVFFQNSPLKNTKVRVWHRDQGTTRREELTTDEAGEINFALEPAGEWMISCVKMIRFETAAEPAVDGISWQSYWGSCTWGYE